MNALSASVAAIEARFTGSARFLALFTAVELPNAPLASLYRTKENTRLLDNYERRKLFRTSAFTRFDLASSPSCTLAGAAFLPPLITPPVSGFGLRPDPITGEPQHHTGLDFPATTATPVLAAAAGVVTRADLDAGGYGRLVEVDHGYGVRTRYAHLSQLNLEAGSKVSAGAVVGLVGSTGRSTGPHLHFEVLLDGVAVDPIPWL
jgi:murein DD-endopeptidase MepM/ murein hydrolase activator NlpD